MRSTTIALIVALFPAMAAAWTPLSGDLHTVSLAAENSPYLVEKDLFVGEGKKVIIPAGCVFLFQPFTGIVVHGQLVVQGNDQQPVVFSTINNKEFNQKTKQLPNPFDWNGIYISENSHGSHFNHFVLSYSVYGIKSQSLNVLIQNGIFRHNGQFHFTIDDKIQYVQDNIPFSFDAQRNLKRQERLSEGEEGPLPRGATPGMRRKTVLTITGASLAAAAIGGIGSGVFHYTRMGEWEERMANERTTRREYDLYLYEWEKNRQRSLLSFIGGGICIPASAVTFFIANRKGRGTGDRAGVSFSAGRKLAGSGGYETWLQFSAPF